jgi:1,4-dihydroxy-2-naphthoyl-CoA hydrolase
VVLFLNPLNGQGTVSWQAGPMTQAQSTPSPAPLTAAQADGDLGALAKTMGIRLTELSADRVSASMPVEGNTQPYGLLHGGASVVLAETVGSRLAVLVAGEGRAAVGVTINATHHRPATSGLVTATATVLHAGRTMATLDIAVTDEQGRRICTSTLVCQLREAPPKPRR